ncbi:septum formation initiator [Luminiphilus syltensis NOR5-1B]|uniref:Cell division protein FtsB n=1 Tax=Luminiphilus syltensis NOR5-1B TaxID=565045 RepID=B8KSY9_9GAMM|nr:cell division protein FtsB [Luminiphilus syltensis]EED35746.1 septum formation initiator [Luminiphilus syltensis NOR5-1B]
MRWLLGVLVALLVLLQYRLWLAEGGIAEATRLRQQIAEEQARNAEIQLRNDALEKRVLELQSGNKVIEQRAREDLGLVREGERYYQFAEPLPGGDARE